MTRRRDAQIDTGLYQRGDYEQDRKTGKQQIPPNVQGSWKNREKGSSKAKRQSGQFTLR